MLPKLKQYHAINQRIHIKKITIHTPEGISNPNQSNNPSPISITTFSTKKTSPFLIKIAQKLFPQLKTSPKKKKKLFTRKNPRRPNSRKKNLNLNPKTLTSDRSWWNRRYPCSWSNPGQSRDRSLPSPPAPPPSPPAQLPVPPAPAPFRWTWIETEN